MSFIAENWMTIAKIVITIVFLVAVILLYYKNKINEEGINALIDYLDTIDDGVGIVPLLAEYAKKAVTAVEQMVKAGIIPKENEPRKNMATRIVKELAAADGIEVNEVDEIAIDSLIEAEVGEMHKA